MIVDANAVTYWSVETSLSHASRALLRRTDLSAPKLLKLEVANALLKYHRAGMIALEDMRHAVLRIDTQFAVLLDDDFLLDDAMVLSLTHRHSIYDCLYLALALKRREPLATADRRLMELARELSIEVEFLTSRNANG